MYLQYVLKQLNVSSFRRKYICITLFKKHRINNGTNQLYFIFLLKKNKAGDLEIERDDLIGW